MPRDANGNYSLPAGNPVISGTTVESSWANLTMDDIKQALSDSLDRYGRGGMQAEFRFVDGTALKPGISFATEIATGIYRAGANDIRMKVGPEDRMRWTNTGVEVYDVANATWRKILSDYAPGATHMEQLWITHPTDDSVIALKKPVATKYAGIKFLDEAETTRWFLYEDLTAADNLVLSRYNDSGGYVVNSLSIDSATGMISINENITAAGTLEVNNAIYSAGTSAGLWFYHRGTTNRWAWFSDNGNAKLYSTVIGGTVVDVTNTGRLYARLYDIDSGYQAMLTNDPRIPIVSSTNQDANTCWTDGYMREGFYQISTSGLNVPEKPNNANGLWSMESHAGGYGWQLYHSSSGANRFFVREHLSGTWAPWAKLLYSNYGTMGSSAASCLNQGTKGTAAPAGGDDGDFYFQYT